MLFHRQKLVDALGKHCQDSQVPNHNDHVCPSREYREIIRLEAIVVVRENV